MNENKEDYKSGPLDPYYISDFEDDTYSRKYSVFGYNTHSDEESVSGHEYNQSSDVLDSEESAISETSDIENYEYSGDLLSSSGSMYRSETYSEYSSSYVTSEGAYTTSTDNYSGRREILDTDYLADESSEMDIDEYDFDDEEDKLEYITARLDEINIETGKLEARLNRLQAKKERLKSVQERMHGYEYNEYNNHNYIS